MHHNTIPHPRMAILKISTTTELVCFRTDDIVFIKGDGNYSDVYQSNGKRRKLTFKLHYFEETLEPLTHGLFVRVGKSYIVNKAYVSVINLPERYLILDRRDMDNAYKFNISREALKDLKTQMEQEGGQA